MHRDSRTLKQWRSNNSCRKCTLNNYSDSLHTRGRRPFITFDSYFLKFIIQKSSQSIPTVGNIQRFNILRFLQNLANNRGWLAVSKRLFTWIYFQYMAYSEIWSMTKTLAPPLA